MTLSSLNTIKDKKKSQFKMLYFLLSFTYLSQRKWKEKNETGFLLLFFTFKLFSWDFSVRRHNECSLMSKLKQKIKILKIRKTEHKCENVSLDNVRQKKKLISVALFVRGRRKHEELKKKKN